MTDLLAQAIDHHQAGRLDQALALYDQILSAQPRHHDALYLSGVVAAQRQDFAKAVDSIRQAIKLSSKVPGYHSHLGNALRGLGDHAGAVKACQRALALQPVYPEAWYNLGNAWAGLERWEDALAAYEKAVAQRPGLEAAMGQAILMREKLALAGIGSGQWQKVVAVTEGAGDLHALHNRGVALQLLGRWQESLEPLQRAIQKQPGLAAAHNSLGASLHLLGQVEAAIGCFRQAIAVVPDYAEAHTNLGHALLSLGQWQEGWAEYEARWGLADMAGQGIAGPRWNGQPGQGQTLLLWAEQGFGDTLQFCRYAPLAAQRGWRVILRVQTPLVRLLSCLPGVMVVGDDQPLPPFDYQCPLLSLPLVMGFLPVSQAYLGIDPADGMRWRSRVTAPGWRVGLVWAGQARNASPQIAAVDRRRSVDAALLAPLLAVPGVTFYSLQKDHPAPAGVIDLMDQVGDFADTAALITQLDVVIAVDTAVAHLAAALGKPVWLLNRFDSCWRWLRERQDSPWYPTVRQFRQAAPGEWKDVMMAVAEQMTQLSF